MNSPPAWLIGARGAPSAHNTQPWRFTPLPDGGAAVRWDPARTLPAADPTSRDLFLALGAAIEAARLRSAADGSPLIFAPAPAGDDRTIGHLAPADGPAAEADLALAGSLDLRQTARGPHLPRPAPPATLAALRAEAERGDCRLDVTTDPAVIRRLASLARRATAAQLANPAVHAELWRWLRLDPSRPDYRRDGLTADCLLLRGPSLWLARQALPPLRMRRLARFGLHHLLALDAQRTVARSAALCLLTAPATDRAEWIGAGRLLLRLWLIAAGAGLTTHPVSALLDDPATVGPTAALFGAGQVPAALFRLGAAPPAPRSPRLPLDELLDPSPDG